MRGTPISTLANLLLLAASALSAQTPTATPPATPVPTPTPPARIYLSDETIVNTETTNNQKRPSVAVGADGNYLVVWNGDSAEQFYFDIKGQLYNPNGIAIGGEFQIDQAGANRIQYTPEVAADGFGNYIVVWSDFNQTVTDAEVWMRRYDGAANPLAGAVQVNTYTTGTQRLPQVAADATGKFVVVWESQGQDGDGLGVFGQQFDAAGTPVGGEFAVNTNTAGDQNEAAVAMDDTGSFTVVFSDGASGVWGRDFGAFLALDNPFEIFQLDHSTGTLRPIPSAPGDRLFVAHNSASGGVDGRRRSGGALGNPFAILRGDAGACSRPHLTLGPATGPVIPIDAYLVCDRQGGPGFFQAMGLGLKFNPDGSSVEAVPPFALSSPWADPTVVHAAFGSGGRIVGVFQAGPTGPSGSGADIVQRVGAYPFPTLMDTRVQGALQSVLSPDAQAELSIDLTNLDLGTAGLILTGQIDIAPPTRPSGAALTISDATADYGTIPAGATANCHDATGDCYEVTAAGPRPGTHWDESFRETLSTGVHKTWLLHLGESFADVPTSNQFYAFIENLLHNGVTAGGACGGYCPTDGVKRQQMAVFLLKSRYGSSFVPPPATGAVFDDVPISNPFAPWIEALYLLGVTGGCVAPPPPALPSFCPDNIVNRQQMAVFLLKMKESSAYTPPAATGIFTDVPLANPFVGWIEELYNRQVTGGCVAVPLQYCPGNPTNRQQMAAFLVKTFGLLLYGP